jgi:hypothetical protein
MAAEKCRNCGKPLLEETDGFAFYAETNDMSCGCVEGKLFDIAHAAIEYMDSVDMLGSHPAEIDPLSDAIREYRKKQAKDDKS